MLAVSAERPRGAQRLLGSSCRGVYPGARLFVPVPVDVQGVRCPEPPGSGRREEGPPEVLPQSFHKGACGADKLVFFVETCRHCNFNSIERTVTERWFFLAEHVHELPDT